MKIDKYLCQMKDSDYDSAVRIESELEWMHAEILKEYSKLLNLRKEIFYKEQMLASFFKNKCGVFNNNCSISSIVKAFENNLFTNKDLMIDKKASSRIMMEFVVNFFPEWMWKDLKFFEVTQEGYDARAIEPAFIWSTGTGKKKKEIEFKIRIPNPHMIKTTELFDPTKNMNDIDLSGDESFKTQVHVNTDVKRGDWRGSTYNWIGSGYFNDAIRDSIDKWMETNGYKNVME